MRPQQPAQSEAPAHIATAADAYRLLHDRFGEGGGEWLLVAGLDADHRLLALDRYPGAEDHVDLPLRAIVARAIRCGASAVVMGHSHPSGDPRPSAADRAETCRLAGLLAAVEVRLLDHLVFAGARCTSFRQLGLL